MLGWEGGCGAATSGRHWTRQLWAQNRETCWPRTFGSAQIGPRLQHSLIHSFIQATSKKWGSPADKSMNSFPTQRLVRKRTHNLPRGKLRRQACRQAKVPLSRMELKELQWPQRRIRLEERRKLLCAGPFPPPHPPWIK